MSADPRRGSDEDALARLIALGRLTDPQGLLADETLREHRARGGKVVGHACLLTPPELLEAAGAWPFRIRGFGRGRTDLADARLSRFNCSYCRSCLQLALEGGYDLFDGLIETNGCDQLRGMFENWVHAGRAPGLFHYLKVPHVVTDESLAYFTSQLAQLRRALEEGLQREIDDGQIWDAIAQRARLRRKLRRLYALREAARPALSGAEALALLQGGGSLPGPRFEALLDRALEQLARRPKASRPGADGVRVLLGGAATEEIELVEGIERLGARVVTDTLCQGGRSFYHHPEVEAGERREGDPLAALARGYLRGTSCPRMIDDFDLRLSRLRDQAARARVDGAILLHNKFCDVHGVDNTLLRLRLEERGMPVLLIEKEYGGADLGRIRTRVQAFVERIDAGGARRARGEHDAGRPGA